MDMLLELSVKGENKFFILVTFMFSCEILQTSTQILPAAAYVNP